MTKMKRNIFPSLLAFALLCPNSNAGAECIPVDSPLIRPEKISSMVPTVDKTKKFLDCVRTLVTGKKLGALRVKKSVALMEKFFVLINEDENSNLRVLNQLQSKCEADTATVKNMKESESPLLGGAAGYLNGAEYAQNTRATQVVKEFVFPTSHCKTITYGVGMHFIVGGGAFVEGLYCNDTDGSRSMIPSVGINYGYGLEGNISTLTLGYLDRSAANRRLLYTASRDETNEIPVFVVASGRDRAAVRNGPPASRELHDGSGFGLGLQMGIFGDDTQKTLGVRIPLPRAKEWYAKEVLTNYCRSQDGPEFIREERIRTEIARDGIEVPSPGGVAPAQ